MNHPTPSDVTTPVTLANWRTAPHNRRAFHAVRSVVPTARIRSSATPVALPFEPRPFHAFSFEDRLGERHTLDDAIATTCTDALLVVHRGKVIDERYFAGMRPDDPHILMSVSKSITAMLAGALMGRGLLAAGDRVVRHVPEAAGSAFDTATIRHLLDMQVGMAFDEDYHATDGAMIDYRRAMGWNPPEAGAAGERRNAADGLHGFLSRVQPAGEHGAPFRYRSPNTDMLGWVLERAGGADLATLLAQYLFNPMGAEHENYVTVDALGTARPAGGLCITARDLARLGLVMLGNGTIDGRSVLPAEWVHDTFTQGDPDAWAAGDFAAFFPGGSYRNKWYSYGNDLGACTGLGIHGQFLYVAPRTDTVIVRFGSHPQPLDEASEMLWIDLMDAMARSL